MKKYITLKQSILIREKLKTCRDCTNQELRDYFINKVKIDPKLADDYVRQRGYFDFQERKDLELF